MVTRPYHGTDLGLLPAGQSSFASGVSADGTVVVGLAADAGGKLWAVYWDAGSVIHKLPSLATVVPFDTAMACSANGSIIVGQSKDDAGLFHAVTWTGGPSWVVNDLGFLPGGHDSIARGCSANGTVIVGSSTLTASPGNDVPCVWVSGTIAALPPSATAGDAQACSSDGTILFGGSDLAYKWTGGPSWAQTALTLLPGGSGGPVASSANGSISVGNAVDSGNNTNAAFWTGTALTVLTDVLAGAGSLALGCDATGTTIGGSTQSGTAALWIQGEGLLLPVPVGIDGTRQATGVSASGNVAVGFGLVAGVEHAIRWTNAPLIWFRVNNGSWFPSGDPATFTGGISLEPVETQALYATVQGSGDGGISVNFGASAFAHTVPTGYTAGLPAGAGFTTLDPAKAHGSASVGVSHLQCSFPTSAGVAQSVDGYTTGAYYFELVNPTADIFSNSWGGGMGRNLSAGGDWVSWFQGEFNGTDINGGALVTGEGFGQPLASLLAFGTTVAGHVFDFSANVNNIVGVALYLTPPGSELELQNLQVTTTELPPDSHSFVTMRFSDDGGRSWHEKRTQPIGAVGDFHKNIQFRNLGQGRSKVIEVSWSVPVASSFGGGTINVEVAGS